MSQADEETTYIEYTSLALHLADEYFLNNNSRYPVHLEQNTSHFYIILASSKLTAVNI